MSWARLGVILAAERGLNSLLEGSETYFCFSNMIISSEVTGKIKTETNNNKSSLKIARAFVGWADSFRS